jgi:hypothetical protein
MADARPCLARLLILRVAATAAEAIVARMVNRLSIINDALIATGNTPCTSEFDGSDEWRVGLSGFERAVNWMLGRHPWGFAKITTPPLARLPEAASDRFKNTFLLPTDRLLLRAVFWRGVPLAAWGIVDDKLCVDPDGEITAEIIRRAPEAQWSPTFIGALTTYVEAIIYRGLNDDPEQGAARERRADSMADDAEFNDDVQTPGRAMFVGRVAARRGGYRRRS